MHMGGEGHQFHAMDFLIYAYLQSGREADAAKVIEEVKTMPAMHMGSMDRDMQAFAVEVSRHVCLGTASLVRCRRFAPYPQGRSRRPRLHLLGEGHGSARSGDLARRRKISRKSRPFTKIIVQRKKTYEADWRTCLPGRLGMGSARRGKNDEATASLRKVADHEDAVGEEQTSMPAREMLADMLLEMKRPEQALAEYKGDLKFNPKRFNGLYGAAQAAEMAGQARRQPSITPCWSRPVQGRSSERPELAKAKQAVVAKNNL